MSLLLFILGRHRIIRRRRLELILILVIFLKSFDGRQRLLFVLCFQFRHRHAFRVPLAQSVMLGLVHEESQLLVDFVFVLVFEEVLELVDHFVFYFSVFALNLLLHHLLNLVDRLRVDSESIHAALRIDVLHALVRIANFSCEFVFELRAGHA